MRVVLLRVLMWMLVGGLASPPLRAAEIFYMDHDTLTGRYVGAVGPLVLSGDIAPGDYDRLLDKIAADEERFFQQNQIILASDEGDVAEALRIATLVRALFSAVTVGPLTGKCSGACFLIYAAASQRATDGDGLIGVRRLPGVAQFLVDNGVPAAVVAELDAHAAQVYWLTPQDERSLGNRSPAFVRFLKARCGWDEAVEREAYTGVRPLSDLSVALACRTRTTRAEAHKALAAALAARAVKH
jgi:hypothetical protein